MIDEVLASTVADIVVRVVNFMKELEILLKAGDVCCLACLIQLTLLSRGGKEGGGRLGTWLHEAEREFTSGNIPRSAAHTHKLHIVSSSFFLNLLQNLIAIFKNNFAPSLIF